ncbi:ABC transporter permease [Acinetobacter sp. MB5]|uniref:ABC transporter permease n=1 Tax=Acinetobacter sp. MB5 TaxID=2069438 RepID=UPI000DCF90B6|nr:ABC transporter permease [Acinetobacter sp. MB5]
MEQISAFLSRVVSLTRKESHQLLRDKSSLSIGLILPIILILLFGYGLSFDLTHGRVGVVVQHRTPQSDQIIAGLHDSTYILSTQYSNFNQAAQAMSENQIDAIVNLPIDLAEQSSNPPIHIQIITNGRSATIAPVLQGYISGAITTAQAIYADRDPMNEANAMIQIEQRMWFNESANSTWFIVPGLIVLILTLIGAFLTALLIARERERGTLEALFVSPVRPLEIVVAKLIPYLVVGLIDIMICLLAAHFLFSVPIRGSLLGIISASFLYLLVSLLLGLTISGFSQNQFQASQMALLTSFMPAMMLSGFVFDTRNLPLVVQIVSQVLPATHFMTLLKTLFLGGDDWALWFKECAVLLLFVIVFTIASCLSLRKRLR